ncbi:MAG: hypothetical protein KAJ29_00155 [Alphaproteobacteria bacterium]|nr:hypothetical protein [Alphaproteobacteria bacterium]
MEQLGVGHILSAYETRPWFLHDSKNGIMCSAEIRVGPGLSDVEAEIQFLHDEDKQPGSDSEEIEDKDEDENDEENKRAKHGPKMGQDGPEQIMFMRFLPNKEQEWQGVFLIVRGEPYHSKIHSWDERGMAFFCDFIATLQMNELPDVDELIEEHLVDRQRGGRGRRGRVGKKGFKVEQKGMTMGMKG